MQSKKQFIVFISLVLLLFLVINMHFTGCTGTASKKEMTPERKQAIQDSLFNIHKREVAKYFSFGWEPFKQQNYEKARKYFRKVAQIDTTGIYGSILYQSLGTSYLQTGEPDSAEWAYLQGVQNNPDDPYCYKAIGFIYRRGGRYEEALEIYDTLTRLEPDSASHYRFKGEVLVNLEEIEDAIESYEKAVELDPNDAPTNAILANLYDKTGQSAGLIEQRKRLVEQDPENTNKRYDLADVYHKQGQYENAVTELNVILGKEPQNTFALELLGDCYKELEQYTNAVNTYKKIIEINPDDKKNICNLAISYAYLGRYTTALAQANKARKLDPQYGLAHIARGMVYEVAANKVVDKKNGKLDFDDKLVYGKAYSEYTQAKKDLAWKKEAENRTTYLQPLIPTKEDKFMHQNQELPEGDDYSWVK